MHIIMLVCIVVRAAGPKVSFYSASCDAGPSGRDTPQSSPASSVMSAVHLAMAFGAVAAGVAAGSKRKQSFFESNAARKAADMLSGTAAFFCPPAWTPSSSDAEEDSMHDAASSDVACSDAASSDAASSDVEVFQSDLEDEEEDDTPRQATSAPSKPGAGKLWTAAQFPEGIKGPSNWDMLNISAAQDWVCPCPDQNCLSRDRYPSVFVLYEFRKDAQTKSKGLRDTFRQKYIEPAYNATTGCFSRSVKIGDRNDNCIAAAGLAAGLSFATFANARTDATKQRPYHKGRVESRDKLESAARVHLHSYIRDLRGSMEGSKGSSQTKWHTGKRSGVRAF